MNDERTIAARREILRSQVENALKEALPEEEFERIDREINTISRDFLQGRINLAEADRLERGLDRTEGRVTLSSIDEMADLMTILGVPQEEIEWTIKHESEHLAELAKNNIVPIIALQFNRTPKGSVSFLPRLVFRLDPSQYSDEQARQIIRSVLTAVSELSPKDKEQLGEK